MRSAGRRSSALATGARDSWSGQSGGFVPGGARPGWPFIIGTAGAFRPPPWNAHLLLWWGVAEALLGWQPRAPRENWRRWPRERLATYLRGPRVGPDHPSRHFAASLVRRGETILDVGCGAGVNYEVLAAHGRADGYVGVDPSEPSIEIARGLYPGVEFYVGDAARLVSQWGPERFDVVLVRHVLEHLPDFEPAMEQAIAVARRLAVFVFFLTPRELPLGVRKVNLRINPSVYTYVYSRSAVEAFLARRGLHARWTVGVGVSRAGWFAGEVNSVLEVSRRPLS